MYVQGALRGHICDSTAFLFSLFKLNMHPNPLSTGALPRTRTPLEELAMLPRPPSLLGEGDIPSHSPPPRRLPTSGASVLRPPQHKILATPVTDNDIDERLYVQVGPKNVDTLHVREYPTMHFPE